ncbi:MULTISPECIES: phage tail-collar fiber domain-containing protein [Acinetobacter]|uniref:phage tail-collar fiber domain-containing protein n=3 Tax=Moraxellaceae TaxID=468 RepID=UPI000BDE7E63|nr:MULTISPECIES: phage tail protein [Acinetobacter]
MANQQYYSLFTEKGLALLREAIQNGTKLGITDMSFGDGNGVVPEPSASSVKLVNEVYKTQLNRLAPSSKNPNWLEADAVIPSAIGGFNIREVGLWAGNVLVAYSNYPPTYKPSADQGTAQIKTIRIVLQIDNTANFELKIDASVVMATVQYVEDLQKKNLIQAESLDELLAINAPFDGLSVYLKSIHKNLGLGDGTFTYNSAKSNINNGVSVFNGWCRSSFMLVNPLMAGAKADGSDDSEALNKVIKFAQDYNFTVDGLNLEYHCNNVQFDSNLSFINARLIHNKFNQNLNSILTTKENLDNDTDYVENIYFYNLHLDGQRAKHTGLPTYAFQEDGGRHGFRFVRPVRNITLEKCSANNCPVEGIIIFPKISSLLAQTFKFRVQNFKIIDCVFNGNGRHGGSADSVDGLNISKSDFNNNGRHIIDNVTDYSLGTAGRTVKKNNQYLVYGSGFDLEEYTGNAYSRNVTFRDVNMIDNAGTGLVFVRTGLMTIPAHNILISGGKYTKGLDAEESYAISFSAYSNSGDTTYHDDVNIENIHIEGDIKVLKSTIYVAGLNYKIAGTGFYLENSTVNADKPYLLKKTTNSGFFKALYSDAYDRFTQSPGLTRLGKAGEIQNLQLTNKNDFASTTRLQIMDQGFNSRGGLSFKVSGNGDVDTIVNGRYDNPILAINGQYGHVTPAIDNVSDVGSVATRFKNIYAATGTIQTSDERMKQQFRSQSDSEKAAAKEILQNIYLYKFNDSVSEKGNKDARWHTGVKAQQVVSILESHGLNAFDYGLVCFDEWDQQERIVETIPAQFNQDGTILTPEHEIVVQLEREAGNRYSIRPDELIFFLLTAVGNI